MNNMYRYSVEHGKELSQKQKYATPPKDHFFHIVSPLWRKAHKHKIMTEILHIHKQQYCAQEEHALETLGYTVDLYWYKPRKKELWKLG